MYKIQLSGGDVIYDMESPDNYMLTEPKGTFEVGQAGSVTFTMLPQHPCYGMVHTMDTYVSVLRDGTEIFYGRAIDVNVNKVTGELRAECAGAIQFLDDGELPPVGNKVTEGSGDKQTTKWEPIELTASEFFVRCITAYNTDIGNDPKRALAVGTISNSHASEVKSYQITSYTKVKNALDSYLINEYGGFLRVRKDGSTRYIDWIESFGASNASPIQLENNVISQENAITADNFYTVLRPVGNNDLTLPEVTLVVDQELVNRYGRIIQTETFNGADNETDLRNQALSFVSRIGKGLGETASFHVVDLHFLDPSVASIKMGAIYTNLSGFEGKQMMITNMDLNFANPADDSVTFKNAAQLAPQPKSNGSSKGRTAGRGSMSRGIANNFQNVWNHITETEDSLTLHAEQININANRLTEYANEFERYALDTDSRVGALEGTAVIQNSQRIAQAAGEFAVSYVRVPDSKLDETGANPHNRFYYEANYGTYTQEEFDSHVTIYESPANIVMGKPIDNPTVGTNGYRMLITPDTSPLDMDPSYAAQHHDSSRHKPYYTKSLTVSNGTSVILDDEGQKITAVDSLKQIEDLGHLVQEIDGSALWTQVNQITGFVGNFEIRDGVLIIKTGGGVDILRNGVRVGLFEEGQLTGGLIVGKITEDGATIPFANLDSNVTDYTAMGLFDNNSLTGGILVEKLNDATTTTKIAGTRIQIGTLDNKDLNTWAKDAKDGTGVFAKYLTVQKLTAQEISTIIGRAESFTIGKTLWLGDDIRSISGSAFFTTGTVSAKSFRFTNAPNLTNPSNTFSNCIVSATVSNGTLKLTDAYGNETNFNKAASPTFTSGTWDGSSASHKNTLTIEAKVGGTVVKTIKKTFRTTVGTGTSTPPYNIKEAINAFDSSHKAYGYVGCGDEGSYTLFEVDATSEYEKGLPAGISVSSFTYSDQAPSGGTKLDRFGSTKIWANYPDKQGYLQFNVKVHGKTKTYYFPINNVRDASTGHPAYKSGHAAGYKTGYNTGYTEGHDEGYTEGYNKNLPDNITIGSISYNSSQYPSGATHLEALDTTKMYANSTYGNAVGYLSFPVTVHGKTKTYYMTIDHRKMSSGGNPWYGAGYTAGDTAGYNRAVNKLTTKTITANGTYDAPSGKIGFSSVTVNVPTGGGGGSEATIDIPTSAITISTTQPNQAVNPTQLTNLANAVKNNHRTYVWFKVDAKVGTTTTSKWYYMSTVD